MVAEGGEINRRVLGDLVFGNDALLGELEQLVWPFIQNSLVEMIRFHERRAKGHRYPVVLVVEAALLLRAGWDEVCDEVWEIAVSEEEAIRRLIETRGFDEEAALTRYRAMHRKDLGEEARRGRVHAIIRNDFSEEEFKLALAEAWKTRGQWRERAEAAGGEVEVEVDLEEETGVSVANGFLFWGGLCLTGLVLLRLFLPWSRGGGNWQGLWKGGFWNRR